MSARHKARLEAVSCLYEADMRSKNPVDIFSSRTELELSEKQYVKFLLEGVQEKNEKIDSIITGYAQGWDLDRMPAIDRAIARLSIFEVLWENDLDVQVSIDEAVELAKELSTADSSKYINGLLGRIHGLKEMLAD